MRKLHVLLGAALLLLLAACGAHTPSTAASDEATFANQGFADANQGNPIVPGFWGDPSIHKFGDTWYVYATTSGGGDKGAFTWKSTDRQNWTLEPMSFTNATVTDFWAPSALAANGKYYLYYSKALNGMFAAEGPTPEGPWTETQLFGPSGVDIDPQPFVDNDGTTYLYWGTAGVLKAAKLSADLTSFAETPRELSAPNYYEGPQMIRRGAKYILTYSEGWFFNESYKVRYATADSPFGPFAEGANSPILTTTGDIHGPGHHSLFSDNGQDYIIYHRHQIPYNPFWELNRQLAVDPISIGNDGTVADVVPSHEGVAGWGWRFDTNKARNAVATATSVWQPGDVPADSYLPGRASDDNNATRWIAGAPQPQALTLDLGTLQPISRVQLAFEDVVQWTQYLVEYSADGSSWLSYADETTSTSQIGILTHDNAVSARYVRVTVTNKEDPGRWPGVTEFKVF